ncbi:MAG: Hsp20/alpha crystallin family protein [Thermoguttaceae bacterium]|nr:Hsp20/alpha crystallin family protein [Thermoguttaceae bacterium]MDW8079242.1 Hsp20/alpha crystallin family protein [Thermoguttaceae bacterium]
MADEKRMRRTPEEGHVEHLRQGVCYLPLVDIVEKAEEIILKADIPGTRPENIDVNFEDGILTIYAKVDPRQEPGTQYLLREYGVGDYHRSFQVSEAIDASRITAEYADGVLTLHLPKAEAARPRKIPVQVSS